MSPTRELAMQTLKFADSIGKFTDLRTCLLVGGDSLEQQFARLADNPDILVATPGRLMHHLLEVKTFNLAKIEFVVFDEAYQETFPMADGCRRRVSVYVLYHLLNHLNLFGSGYLGQCHAVAAEILQH